MAEQAANKRARIAPTDAGTAIVHAENRAGSNADKTAKAANPTKGRGNAADDSTAAKNASPPRTS